MHSVVCADFWVLFFGMFVSLVMAGLVVWGIANFVEWVVRETWDGRERRSESPGRREDDR